MALIDGQNQTTSSLLSICDVHNKNKKMTVKNKPYLIINKYK